MSGRTPCPVRHPYRRMEGVNSADVAEDGACFVLVLVLVFELVLVLENEYRSAEYENEK
jgi:hypothetical protein